MGQLGTKKLTVEGTVFIDGSATIDSPPSAQATVTGQGALILTGTFAMKNSLMCVKTVGSGMGTHCDTSANAWDPDLSSFIVVADGDGGYDTTQNQGNTVGRATESSSRAPTSRAASSRTRTSTSTPPHRCRGR